MASTSVSPPAPVVDVAALLAPAYDPKFPPAWAVPVAAGTLFDAADSKSRSYRDAHEGPEYFARIGPGMVSFGSYDPARAERAAERAARVRACRVALGVAWRLREDVRAATDALRAAGLIDEDQVLDSVHDPLLAWESRARITEWSAKSRSNMIRRYSTLDFEPMLSAGRPAMVTLTLPSDRVWSEDCGTYVVGPGDWSHVLSNGQAFKRLFRLWRKRFRRAWGSEWVGLWKLEFQRRGAPHLHMLMVPPTGTSNGQRWAQWFAGSWSSIVVDAFSKTETAASGLDLVELRRKVYAVHQHPSACADYAEGLKATDPRRVAVYFLKHNTAGDKEYQHIVPAEWRGEGDGPGRFWGNPGLQRADQAVPLSMQQALQLSRTLRRWDRAQGRTHRAKVWRVDTATGEVRKRTAHRRVKSMRGSRGFLLVNDGPAVALMLAGSLRT